MDPPAVPCDNYKTSWPPLLLLSFQDSKNTNQKQMEKTNTKGAPATNKKRKRTDDKKSTTTTKKQKKSTKSKSVTTTGKRKKKQKWLAEFSVYEKRKYNSTLICPFWLRLKRNHKIWIIFAGFLTLMFCTTIIRLPSCSIGKTFNTAIHLIY